MAACRVGGVCSGHVIGDQSVAAALGWWWVAGNGSCRRPVEGGRRGGRPEERPASGKRSSTGFSFTRGQGGKLLGSGFIKKVCIFKK